MDRRVTPKNPKMGNFFLTVNFCFWIYNRFKIQLDRVLTKKMINMDAVTTF